MEVQFLGNLRQLRHICLGTSRMTGDEVGDELLVEVLLLIDAIEKTLEVVELLERRLAHQLEHLVAGMFRCHLQPSADMTGDELAGILHGGLVACLVLAAMQDEVVANPAADETFLDTR